MVLIVTEREDYTADWLIRELEERGAPFVRFNTEDYPRDVAIAWRPSGAVLNIKGAAHPLADFAAVWYRRPVSPRAAEGLSPAAAEWAVRESWEALQGAWRTLDALWVNHPDHNRLAESKPEQLRTAPSLGFDVPASLVTNDVEELRRFMAEHAEGVVCKPLWSGKLPGDNGAEEQLFFTSLLDPEQVPVDALGPEPYLFQARIPKRFDVRVTVIGDKVFAARIDSQVEAETQTDWRKSSPGRLRHEPLSLPGKVEASCLRLCRHYGLQFGAIDLACREDGGYTFFEVNPNGQWAWVEQQTGQPLRSALADLLLSPGGNKAADPDERNTEHLRCDPRPVEERPWLERVRFDFRKDSKCRWLYDKVFLPIRAPTEFLQPEAELVRDLMPWDAHGNPDEERTKEVLAEAQATYESADARGDSAQSRATTLQGAVAVAASLLLAGGALLSDPTKVRGDCWRVAFAVVLFAVVFSLVASGARALAATSRIQIMHSPSAKHIVQRSGRSAADARVELAAEFLRAYACNTRVADWKVAYLGAAAWWFRWALLGLLLLALLLGLYGGFGPDSPPTQR